MASGTSLDFRAVANSVETAPRWDAALTTEPFMGMGVLALPGSLADAPRGETRDWRELLITSSDHWEVSWRSGRVASEEPEVEMGGMEGVGERARTTEVSTRIGLPFEKAEAIRFDLTNSPRMPIASDGTRGAMSSLDDPDEVRARASFAPREPGSWFVETREEMRAEVELLRASLCDPDRIGEAWRPLRPLTIASRGSLHGWVQSRDARCLASSETTRSASP